MGTIIRLPQQHRVNIANRNVQDALITLGEEFIALNMYHIGDDEGIQPRCPVCWDEDYKQGEEFSCPECFGTTFLDGVKNAQRVLGIFTDSASVENFKRLGESDWKTQTIQIEAAPHLKKNDYAVRVLEWQTKVVLGTTVPYPKRLGEIYRFDTLKEVTLRTGTRYGQANYDKIGQMADAHELPKTHPIYKYVIPEPILRIDEAII